jgi:hypothetical protein
VRQSRPFDREATAGVGFISALRGDPGRSGLCGPEPLWPRVWNKAHYGAFHLYGHSHGSLPPQGRSHDVGTNVWDYRPVTLAEVKERLDALGLLESYGVHHGQEATPAG